MLAEWRGGSDGALHALIPLVYQELHKRAHHYLRAERPGHTLQSTALVHEASGKGFVHVGREQKCSRAMMQEACAALQLLRAMVFRLLAKYREDRRLSAVLLHPRRTQAWKWRAPGGAGANHYWANPQVLFNSRKTARGCPFAVRTIGAKERVRSIWASSWKPSRQPALW